MEIDIIFESTTDLVDMIEQHNDIVGQLSERKKKKCRIHATDSYGSIVKKCARAYHYGAYFYPLVTRVLGNVDNDNDADDNADGDGGTVSEAMSSTERVRKYYRKHPEKVRAYLRKTAKDRSARNRDRRKAVKKYGKSKMKNHDVHHPKGPHGGSWRLAKKDHGPDKKKKTNENFIMEGGAENNEIHPAIISHPCNLEIVHHSINESKGIKNSMLYEELIMNIKQFDEIHNQKTLLMCGGAAGHLAHPYEDVDLTFAEIKQMIDRSLVGQLDTEGPVTEKLDGQNIAFTVRDGKVIFARNKGHVKNRGENGLNAIQLAQKFGGRGEIEKAFTATAEDIEEAINGMSEEEINNIFGNGRRFMNSEIIYSGTQNVIPYDKNVIIFHGTIEYDDDGNEVNRSLEHGDELAEAINRTGRSQQKTFNIGKHHAIAFDAEESEEYRQLSERLQSAVNTLAEKYNLADNATIGQYLLKYWTDKTQEFVKKHNIRVDREQFKGLIKRWALDDKTLKLTALEPETRKAIRDFEATELQKERVEARKPVEFPILIAGTYAIKRASNLLSANNPDALRKLKSALEDTIKQIRDSKDGEQLRALNKQLKRLKELGMDNMVPSEGIVFIHNGKPYKFTGTFAPVNQIMGTLKFVKEKKEPKQEKGKKIVIFTGRFQPFHKGHYSVYKALVDKFGEENVYIATSNSMDPVKSPFSFVQKKEIMTKMFGINPDKVQQVKNPYKPEEILSRFPDDTQYITAVSQKDAERLDNGGKYFKPYKERDSEVKGYKDGGYFIVAPEFQLNVMGKNISGTQMRAVMGSDISDAAKKKLFQAVYGGFDQHIFDTIVSVTRSAEKAKQSGESKPKTNSTSKPKEPVAGDTKQKQPQPEEPKSQRHKIDPKATIINPKTKKKILVHTALSYPKDHPAYKVAQDYIKNSRG
jgi:CDGSH-type Zn-finger protein